MLPEKLWHYTPRIRLKEIVDSRKIRLTDKGIAKGEKPAVWVSSNPVWENTATKMVPGINGKPVSISKDEMYLRLGLGRIQVIPSEKYITWAKFKHASKIPFGYYLAMESAGTSKGANPKEWYARFTSIPIEEWLMIEYWDGNEWIEEKEYQGNLY